LKRRREQIFLPQLRLERAITFGFLSLQLHGPDLAFDLPDDVCDAQEVLLGSLQFRSAKLRFCTYWCRFFDEAADLRAELTSSSTRPCSTME
jgi:hypothetical protein